MGAVRRLTVDQRTRIELHSKLFNVWGDKKGGKKRRKKKERKKKRKKKKRNTA
jgi:hypothetical protein